jgi:helix-turn-helix protein
MPSRWCCQKSGRPASRTRGRAGCSRRRKAERATRLWADWNEPRKLAVSTERTKRCNAAKATSRASWGAPGFGYRRLYRMLRREKENGTANWVVNHKRVYRLYREEGLAMQRRKGRRFRSEARVPLELPGRSNQTWTMDAAWGTGHWKNMQPKSTRDRRLPPRRSSRSHSRWALKDVQEAQNVYL